MAKKETPVNEVLKFYRLGIKDSEVVKKLSEEGYSPVQISDALNQAKIKQEIGLSGSKKRREESELPYLLDHSPGEESEPEKEENEDKNKEEESFKEDADDESHYKPMIQDHKSKTIKYIGHAVPHPHAQQPHTQIHDSRKMPEPKEEDRESRRKGIPVPRPSVIPPAPKKNQQESYDEPKPSRHQDEFSGSQMTASYPYQYPTYPESSQRGANTEEIHEIAEEIVNEKWQEIKDKIGDLGDWKTHAERRLASAEERLERLESSLDRLQSAILSKVNDYGKDIKNLGAEMSSIEGVLGKVLGPMLDNVKELGKMKDEIKSSIEIPGKPEEKTEKKRRKASHKSKK